MKLIHGCPRPLKCSIMSPLSVIIFQMSFLDPNLKINGLLYRKKRKMSKAYGLFWKIVSEMIPKIIPVHMIVILLGTPRTLIVYVGVCPVRKKAKIIVFIWQI